MENQNGVDQTRPRSIDAKRIRGTIMQSMDHKPAAFDPQGEMPDDMTSGRGNSLRGEIITIEDLDAFKALRRAWEELAAAAQDYSQCATYGFCEVAAARALAKSTPINIAMVYDDGGLLAIWPLAIHRKGLLRIAKGLTCGSGEEYGGPLVRGRADKEAVTAAVSAAMKAHADILEIVLVEEGSVLQEALDAAPQSWMLPLLPHRLGSLPGYAIRLRGIPRWEDFLATLPRSLRENLRRDLKRLNASGRTEIGWCTTVDDAEAVLTWLFANKRQWSQSRGLNTPYLEDDRLKDFFVALAGHTDLSSIPLVAFVKVNGVPVAASVNLVGKSCVEGFFTTYDDAFRLYSVGTLLVEFLVKWSHANDLDFDFRPLEGSYKARWANSETRHKTRIIFLSPRGRLAEFSLLAGHMSRLAAKVRKIIISGFAKVKARVA
ncbi:conserved hypothetical protein [Methylocella tundrae]|nr:conserved hypothetical protein [Methylocella tundrae]